MSRSRANFSVFRFTLPRTKPGTLFSFGFGFFRPLHIRISRDSFGDRFFGVVTAKDFQKVVFHAEGEGIVNQIDDLVGAFVADERLVGDREVLHVDGSRNHAAGNIQTLAHVSLHLGAENSGGFEFGNFVADFGVVVANQNFVAIFADLFSEPLGIVFAVGSGANDANAHFPCEDLGDGGGVGVVAENEGALAGEVLAVDRAGKPGGLRNVAGLVVDVFFVIDVGAAIAQQCLNFAREPGGFDNADRANIDVGHPAGFFQIAGQPSSRFPGRERC